MAGYAWTKGELQILKDADEAKTIITADWCEKNLPGRTPPSVRKVKQSLKAMTPDEFIAARKLEVQFSKPVADPPQIPSAGRGIDALLSDLQKSYERKKTHHEAKKNVVIRMPDDGPYCCVAFGDPHAGDPGCDIAHLSRLLAWCRETPRVHPFNVGDLTNNWVGSLSRLYASQDTTASEEYKLIQWIFDAADWLFLIGGNHDHFGPVAELLAKTSNVLYVRHGGQFKLVSGEYSTTIDCRHSHRGNSQYDPAFAAKKQAYRGNPADIIVSGHIHTSASGVIPNGVAGTLSHTVRVGAFKKYDDYADANHFDHDDIGPAAFFVVRPYVEGPGKVHCFWDEESAELFLKASVSEWENSQDEE